MTFNTCVCSIDIRWIDVTYLSERLRITRGNKGTLFILRKLSDDEIEGDPSASLAVARIRPVSSSSSESMPTATQAPKINSKPASSVQSSKAVNSRSSAQTTRESSSSSSSSSDTVAIIFPAQLGVQQDYESLSDSIRSRAQIPCFTPALSRLDWPVRIDVIFRDYF